jgi:proline iminopeptidase
VPKIENKAGVSEQRFEVEISGGLLQGHRGGTGPPALLLHGGPAVPDYLDGLVAELDGVFSTCRYTQRGTPPSGGGPPYTVEAHMADALAVLDALDIERAWAVGHSWGGHLALHLLGSQPQRLVGAICVNPLGAFGDALVEMDASFRRSLTPEQVARIDGIEERRRAVDVTEAELVERWALVWPLFFADPGRASPPPARVGVEASIWTNRSMSVHFERGTLTERLPRASAPALFVHGEVDPLPPSSSVRTAALVPGAKVEVIPGCGHFPWLEQPGSVRRAVETFLAHH